MSSIRGRCMRLALTFVCLLAVALALAGPAAAFDGRSQDAITIAEGEVVNDDLILFGNDIVVNGTVNGDLLAFGNNVTVNGAVNGSLVLAARMATLNAPVSGSVYSVVAALLLGPAASVGRNVYCGAYSVETAQGSLVRRDAVLAAYQAVLGGRVTGDAQVASAALELNGTVDGDIMALVGDPSGQGMRYWSPSQYMQDLPSPLQPGLRVGTSARLRGKLTYTSRAEQAATITVQPEGGVVFHLETPAKQPEMRPSIQVDLGAWLRGWFIGRVREFLALAILGALVLWKLPSTLRLVADSARARPLPALGWGLVAILVARVGMIVVGLAILALALLLALVTLGGLAGPVLGVGMSALALASSLFSVLVTYGSKLVVAYLLGTLIVKRLLPSNSGDRRLELAVGIVVYLCVRAIPILGWLFGALVTLVGVGAMWLAYQHRREAASNRTTAVG